MARRSAAGHAGDFSTLLKLGATYQIFNPFIARPAATAGRYRRDPIPGNLIPKRLLNAVGLNLIDIYRLPKQTGLVSTNFLDIGTMTRRAAIHRA